MDIDPVPSDDETAAIIAAYELLWPKPTVVGAPRTAGAAWRFSGRWWTGTAIARRSRP